MGPIQPSAIPNTKMSKPVAAGESGPGQSNDALQEAIQKNKELRSQLKQYESALNSLTAKVKQLERLRSAPNSERTTSDSSGSDYSTPPHLTPGPPSKANGDEGWNRLRNIRDSSSDSSSAERAPKDAATNKAEGVAKGREESEGIPLEDVQDALRSDWTDGDNDKASRSSGSPGPSAKDSSDSQEKKEKKPTKKGKLEPWERERVDSFLRRVITGEEIVYKGELAKSLREHVNTERSQTFFEKLISRRQLNQALRAFLRTRKPTPEAEDILFSHRGANYRYPAGLGTADALLRSSMEASNDFPMANQPGLALSGEQADYRSRVTPDWRGQPHALNVPRTGQTSAVWLANSAAPNFLGDRLDYSSAFGAGDWPRKAGGHSFEGGTSSQALAYPRDSRGPPIIHPHAAHPTDLDASSSIFIPTAHTGARASSIQPQIHSTQGAFLPLSARMASNPMAPSIPRPEFVPQRHGVSLLAGAPTLASAEMVPAPVDSFSSFDGYQGPKRQRLA